MKTTGIPTWFGVAETASASAPPAASEFKEALGRAQAPPGDPPPAETQSAGEGEVVSIGPNAPEQELDSTAKNNLIAQILGMTITVPTQVAPIAAPEISAEQTPPPIAVSGLTGLPQATEVPASKLAEVPVLVTGETMVDPLTTSTGEVIAEPQKMGRQAVETSVEGVTVTPGSTDSPVSEAVQVKNEKINTQLMNSKPAEAAPAEKPVSQIQGIAAQLPTTETVNQPEKSLSQVSSTVAVVVSASSQPVNPQPVTKPVSAGETEDPSSPDPVEATKSQTVDAVKGPAARTEEALTVVNPLEKSKGKLPVFESEANEDTNFVVAPPAKTQAVSTAQSFEPAKELSSSDQEKVVRQVLEHVDYLVAAAPRKEITIRLEPRELGSLLMKISQNGGEVEAKIEATEPAVRAALLDNRPTLDRSLAQKGMVLGDVTVNPQLGSDRNAGQHERNQSSAPAPTFAGTSPDLDVNVEETRTVRRSGRDVDLWI